MKEHLKGDARDYVLVAAVGCMIVYSYFFASIIFRALPSPDVSLSPREGYSFRLQPGQVIDLPAFLQYRHQYVLRIENRTDATFSDLDLRLQMPYPVEMNAIESSEGTANVIFDTPDLNLTMEGKVSVVGTLVSGNYRLRVSRLEPYGEIVILMLLNSSNDPRGRTISPGERFRYQIPEVGPATTYIDGRLIVYGTERNYYVPLELGSNKLVRLGTSNCRPERLRVRGGFEIVSQ